MKRGDKAILKMKQTLKKNMLPNEQEYQCLFIENNRETECLYLALQDAKLENISLDAVYQCEIKTGEGIVSCTGTIGERYYGANGKMLRLKIRNGFYKISIK